MNWESLLLLIGLFTFMALVVIRAEKRARKIVILVLPAPILFFIIRWANYRDTWVELGIALASSGFLVLLWWFIRGRSLPKVESSIRVWDKEDPF